jgi:hypothetical protein
MLVVRVRRLKDPRAMNVADNLLYVSASAGGEEWVERTSFRAQLKRWP